MVAVVVAVIGVLILGQNSESVSRMVFYPNNSLSEGFSLEFPLTHTVLMKRGTLEAFCGPSTLPKWVVNFVKGMSSSAPHSRQ